MQKPELLAPAGDMEKLKMAVRYGADAVYLGSNDFSLRAQAKNFTDEQLTEAIDFAHSHGVKVYLTVNVYPQEQHLADLRALLVKAAGMGVDAFIVADPGVFRMAAEVAPQVQRHISTQANCTNSQTAEFWREQGASRVILGREVSLENCRQMAARVPIELEIFVHGAVCMSYSGRCLLSSFLTGRSANLGDCAQPCRWQYRLEEARRPGAYMPIEEDRWGSYIFNSKDLCLIELLPEILQAGVASLKIEGRMKSAYYVANVTRIYRQALDSCWAVWENLAEKSAAACRQNWQFDADWLAELGKISHRKYFTGFAQSEPGAEAYVYDTTYSFRGYDFAGVVQDYDAERKRVQIEQRNLLTLGDEVEIISPKLPPLPLKISGIWSEDGEELTRLPHARQIAWLACDTPLPEGSIIRRAVPEERRPELSACSLLQNDTEGGCSCNE